MIDVQTNYTVGLPIAASTYAGRVDQSLHILHIGMLTIFVLWGLFFAYSLIRFRSGKSKTAVFNAKQGGAASFVPDVMVLAFEVWLIFFFGLPIWSQIKEKFPPENESVVVTMVAEQFAWGFQYPGPDGVFGRRDPLLMSPTNSIGLDASDPAAKDDVISVNELHVPMGKPTIVYLTSKDVIHSFFVPEFRVKQDAVPGMRIPLWFEPTRAGRYELVCAQLCGLGHYRMRGEVVVHEPEDYDRWLADKAKEAAELGES